jgi:hypothetical protein
MTVEDRAKAFWKLLEKQVTTEWKGKGLEIGYPKPFKRDKKTKRVVAYCPYNSTACYKPECRGIIYAEDHLHKRQSKKKDGPWHGLPIEEHKGEAGPEQLSLL